MAIPTRIGRYLVNVVGNIGSGKSTLLRALAARGVPTLLEDPEAWGPLFKMGIEDPLRWKTAAQIAILVRENRRLLWRLEEMDPRLPLVIERSPACAVAFTAVAYRAGQMTEEEALLAHEVYRLTRYESNLKIYLRTPYALCSERVEARGRAYENPHDLDLLRRLEEEYDKCDAHVIIDGSASRETVLRETIEALKRAELVTERE